MYIMPGFENYSALLEQLGKYRLGKSCLYIKKLSDVDITILLGMVLLAIIAKKLTLSTHSVSRDKQIKSQLENSV